MSLFAKAKKARENKKGFTLVELIVVIVILAILAAILVPALLGWIDKAKEKQLTVSGRTVMLAAQSAASEAYGLPTPGAITDAKIQEYLKADNGSEDVTGSYAVEFDNYKVKTVQYTDGKKLATYTQADGWVIDPEKTGIDMTEKTGTAGSEIVVHTAGTTTT